MVMLWGGGGCDLRGVLCAVGSVGAIGEMKRLLMKRVCVRVQNHTCLAGSWN